MWAFIAFCSMLAYYAVKRWRDGKSMRPTQAGVNRWVVIVLVIVLVIVGFGLLFWAAAHILTS